MLRSRSAISLDTSSRTSVSTSTQRCSAATSWRATGASVRARGLESACLHGWCQSVLAQKHAKPTARVLTGGHGPSSKKLAH
jgi:hypothetical protein